MTGHLVNSRSILAAIVATELVAVICQFAQRTDPRCPLVYFTVWSGILAGSVAAAQLPSRQMRAFTAARTAAAVGVIVSGVIFAVVIAPASYTGTWFQPWDDVYVRVANTLFHGLAPVLVLADFILRPPMGRFRVGLAAACCWPIAYMISLALASRILTVQPPYPFLDPRSATSVDIFLAISGIFALILLTTFALFAAAKARRWLSGGF